MTFQLCFLNDNYYSKNDKKVKGHTSHSSVGRFHVYIMSTKNMLTTYTHVSCFGIKQIRGELFDGFSKTM